MTINIIEALDDPALFAPLFRGPSWGPWRAFLGALFGLPLDDEALALYQHHTGRAEPSTRPFKEAALICGRRGGKSRVLALTAVYLAAFHDYQQFLAPGEQGIIAIVAADRKQGRIILRYIIGTMRAVPLLAPMIEGTLAESVTLTNGVVIEIHTGSIASPRGRTFIAVLADEIAFWRSEDSANPDVEVIAAIKPGLLSIPTSILLMASSPYARRGVLWDTFRRHWGRDDARTLVWRGTTLEMNCLADPVEIAEAYEADPENAAAEYGAEFRTDVSSFIDRAVVAAAVTPGRHELPPMAMTHYSAFVDPSGGSSDSFTLAIAHGEGDRGVLDCVREVRPPFSPEAIVAEFGDILKSYGVHEVTGDRYGGEWPRERFREHGIEYITSERTKSEIYKELLPLLNSGKVDLLDNSRLVSQLCSLERRTARGGRDSIDHPSGSHDDVANSVAGVLTNVAGGQSTEALFAMWRRLGDLPEAPAAPRTPQPVAAEVFPEPGKILIDLPHAINLAFAGPRITRGREVVHLPGKTVSLPAGRQNVDPEIADHFYVLPFVVRELTR